MKDSSRQCFIGRGRSSTNHLIIWTFRVLIRATIRAERVDETIAAVKRVHPYEEPVINAIPLWRTGF